MFNYSCHHSLFWWLSQELFSIRISSRVCTYVPCTYVPPHFGHNLLSQPLHWLFCTHISQIDEAVSPPAIGLPGALQPAQYFLTVPLFTHTLPCLRDQTQCHVTRKFPFSFWSVPFCFTGRYVLTTVLCCCAYCAVYKCHVAHSSDDYSLNFSFWFDVVRRYKQFY